MNLPIFNYPSLVKQLKQYPVLDLENSILMLHFLDGQQLCELSSGMHTALENFERWKTHFLSINDIELCKQNIQSVTDHFDTYLQMFMKCVLRAELYNWRMFEYPAYINMQPIFAVVGNKLVYTRPLKHLL